MMYPIILNFLLFLALFITDGRLQQELDFLTKSFEIQKEHLISDITQEDIMLEDQINLKKSGILKKGLTSRDKKPLRKRRYRSR